MLVYDGILASEVLRACKEAADKGYRYAVEFHRPPPPNWENGLAVRKWREHQRSNEAYEERLTYEMTGKKYVLVQRDIGECRPIDSMGAYNGGMFVFLVDEQDYQTVLRLDNIASAKPFKTILGAFNG